MSSVRNGIGVLLAALIATPPAPSQSTRHAGIELGGRGVKVSAVEATPTAASITYRNLYGKTTNTSLALLRDGLYQKAAIEETVAAVAEFVRLVTTEHAVPRTNIYIVASSGLPAAGNRDDLLRAIRASVGPGVKDVTVLDAKREVELTIRGVVSKDHWNDSVLLDVGGGNTKGGFLVPMGGVDTPGAFALGMGSLTYTTRVREHPTTADRGFAAVAADLRPTLTDPLRQAVKQLPGIEKRTRVYLCGGIAWACATFQHPESVDAATVDLSAADIERFREAAILSKGKLPQANLSAIADPDLRNRAEKQVRSVADTFTPDQLIAGSELLKALSEAFQLEGKTLVFPRDGYLGWITAYVKNRAGGVDAATPPEDNSPQPPASSGPAGGSCVPLPPPLLYFASPSPREIYYVLPTRVFRRPSFSLLRRCR